MFVAVILVSAVTVTYSTIRYNTMQEEPLTLSAIDETNLALKQVLGFTVGYYGSVLQVTGNYTYARELATDYMSSGLENIANVRPEWGPSFDVTDLELSTDWFKNESYSEGTITVDYDLTGLGISGVIYTTSCRLDVKALGSPVGSQIRLNVFKDDNETLMNLGSHNFKFYRYIYSNASWDLATPTLPPTMFANGTYLINVPDGIDENSYVLQVEDSRGIVTVVASFNHYSCTLNWESGAFTTPNERLTVELLQNGTLRWLGQNLELTTSALPLPPIPVKSMRINQTVSGVDQEVPFQVEDWASEYRIPLGLTSNYTVISNKQMIVFQVSPAVSKVTVWWDGHDTASQSPYSVHNPTTSPFRYDDVSSVDNAYLGNGVLDVTITNAGDRLQVISELNSMTGTAELMRIDNERSWYGSDPSYVIHHGVVRDIVQAEPEWEGGAGGTESTNTCPNTLAQVVITLPAYTPYFTFQSRLIFLESTRARQVSDLCAVSITVSPSGFVTKVQTENGTSVADTTSPFNFYNFTGDGWAHHWSQATNDASTKGAGILFTDSANQRLYAFDLPGAKTGALKADFDSRRIELLPVTNQTSLPLYAQDITWSGAIAVFDSTTPIFKMVGGTPTGLWVFVEHPPTIAVSTSS